MDENKKRLMYIQSEDFYFLTYNTIILLNTLNCIEGDRYLKDYRKISFLVDFTSNPYYAAFLKGGALNESDKREMTRLYSNGILRQKEINKLFYALDSRGIIHLTRKSNSDILDVTLNKSKVPAEFFDGELFEVEIQNSMLIKNHISRLSSITLDTLKQKLFTDKGVKVWQLF